MPSRRTPLLLHTLLTASLLCGLAAAQPANPQAQPFVSPKPIPAGFPLLEHRRIPALVVEPGNPELVQLAAQAFAGDLESVSGVRPEIRAAVPQGSPTARPQDLILVGVRGQSPAIDALCASLQQCPAPGAWESALTAVVSNPMPGVRQALVIAAGDRRGAAFALFDLSRQIGVSPWNWWADVPARRHDTLYLRATAQFQPGPSIPFRGIFLNDEDWGLRPWAAQTLDRKTGNIGPRTYERVFELLLRLRANTLWPAMHPGTLPFNALPENARLADRWGIIMGSSHSEALLRNNVGEWDEKRDGPWNYQLNRGAIERYWGARLQQNGQYENLYTVGMRGVHDTGLEAEGSTPVRARLVEQVMKDQRVLLARSVGPDITRIPQVIWLYKESLELYRAGMAVPDDVTLGWTDDNYGYLRQLPDSAEQKRAGGSGVYYHVSYWGFPHDYLWLCSTPPALIREEMTKAFDHQARRLWILNVGDLKPAEIDVDYFMQLAWNEPALAVESQHDFLKRWSAEQFPTAESESIATLLDRYYQLNFIRKPEFMGFNGYEDGIQRTAFNPNAWGDQNRQRLQAWQSLRENTLAEARKLPVADTDAFFELVGYPIQAAAAQNEKFLYTDRSFLNASRSNGPARLRAAQKAQAAFDTIQSLTARYNFIEGGKWQRMMSATPRDRQVFKMSATAPAGPTPLPAAWATGNPGAELALSLPAARFSTSRDNGSARWTPLLDLGISGGSVVFGSPGKVETFPGLLTDAPWLQYNFSVLHTGPAKLTLWLLPTFPVDSAHRLRYGVALDGRSPQPRDASGSGEWQENSAPTWAANVLRNAAIDILDLGTLDPGKHSVRLYYRDPAVVFEHVAVTLGTPAPAYPTPSLTKKPARDRAHPQP